MRVDANYQGAIHDALDVKLSSERFFTQHFMDYDAIIAPSATGIAPLRSMGQREMRSTA